MTKHGREKDYADKRSTLHFGLICLLDEENEGDSRQDLEQSTKGDSRGSQNVGYHQQVAKAACCEE